MSTIKVGTLLAADGSTTTQPSIPALDKRMAKAWVNFNSVGTLTIQDSYGVSSVTDTNVGNFVVNLTNAVANTTYSVSVSNNYVSNSGYVNTILSLNTGSFGMYLIKPLVGHADTSINTAVVFAS